MQVRVRQIQSSLCARNCVRALWIVLFAYDASAAVNVYIGPMRFLKHYDFTG